MIFEDIEDESPKIIDFFFGVDEEKKELIKIAKYYIDKKDKGETNMKRNYNESVYEVKTSKGNYLVCLEGLKNDVNGNRRYKARMINLGHPTYAIVYTFTGHCCGEQGECEWVVNYHESKKES